jgi:hypothetical protein
MSETGSSVARQFRIISSAAVHVGIAVLLMAGFLLWLWRPPRYTSRDTLLGKTNHAALRAACLELIAGRENFGPEPPPGVSRELDPTDPRIPNIIRSLRPTFVAVSDRGVHIELHGGFDHYGVCFYIKSEDASEGNRELAEGLWYYSEGDVDHQPLPERDKAK